MLQEGQRQRERTSEPAPWSPKEGGPFVGPRTLDVDKPDTEAIRKRLVKRMEAIDKDKAKRYKQRSGE